MQVCRRSRFSHRHRQENAVFANSARVISSQVGVHPRLDEIVAKHLREPYRRTPSGPGRAAFESVVDRLVAADGSFVLDAGCGTGASTLALARRFPQRLVLGVDKSAARLAQGRRAAEASAAPANAILLHCELVDLWQLCVERSLRCAMQFLFYPNPWPKAEHVMRRWHAHPVLPAMLALGGAIELRTNWRIYADEFARALRQAGRKADVEEATSAEPVSPFERKYLASAHTLWCCRLPV